jgi:tetratricopeptide (TPR) repeat protein
MSDTDNTTSLKDQLAAHRRTLAVYLRQLANLGADHAPPGVHNGIDKARAEIARLKAALRAAGVAVEDEIGDLATPDAETLPPAPAHSGPASVNISGGQIIGAAVGANYGSITTNYHAAPAPSSIDPEQAHALLDRLPLDHVPNPTPLPPGSRMPLRPNPLFVGREADLLALAPDLKAGRAAVISTGIGGVGKTQLAAEVAHRYGQFFAGGVFWLSFADPTGVDGEIAACGGAGALELYTDADGLTLAEQVARVYTAWQQPIPRLLIFDNCDDLPGLTAEQQLAAHLPRSGGCRVLVTSRRGQWSPGLGLAPHPLDVLDRTQSVALLRGYRADLSDADAGAIADELGDLPLALTLAGSYLGTYRDAAFGTPATYLTNLRAVLLDHRSMKGAGSGPSFTNHELNVRATVDLSYARLDATDPTDALAIQLLARAAQLAPGEPFPRDLLLAMLGEDEDDEDAAAQRADALLRLVALGLLEDAQGGALRIHRLIAAFARVAIADDAALGAVEQALSAYAYMISDAGYPAAMQPILAHLRHATARALDRADERAATLGINLGFYLKMIGEYAGARPLYERALAICEHSLGPTHPNTAGSLNNLAALLQFQGDYAAARPLYERALAICEQALGPTHPDTAGSLNNLAELLRTQGDYAAARPLYERALSLREQALGPTHPNTAGSLNNLASLLRVQGEYAAARPLYARALAIYEQALGPTHPDTALSLNNLAVLYAYQDDFDRAIPLIERALAIRVHVLGSRHPDTIQTQRSLENMRADAVLQHDQLADPLAALDAPAPSTAQQIAEITAQAEAAVAEALADPSSDRAALAAQLEERARWAEEGEAEDSPYLALAAHLRTLVAQLDIPDEAQELAALLQRAQAATDRARAEGDASTCAALAERLVVTADAYAGGEKPGSQRHNLAVHLRTLAAQLIATDAEHTDTP